MHVIYQSHDLSFAFSGEIRYFGTLDQFDEEIRPKLAPYVKGGALRPDKILEGGESSSSLVVGEEIQSDKFVFMKHGEGNLMSSSEASVVVLLSGEWKLDKLEGLVEV